MRGRLTAVRDRLLRPRPADRESRPFDFFATLPDDEKSLVERALPYSITSAERVIATRDAVEYVVGRGVPGALVECGVWRGGSVLTMILTLQRLGVTDRDLWLYDTFEGMTEPGESDVSRFDGPATAMWQEARATGRKAFEWLFRPEVFSLDHVKELLFGTGYPTERIHFVVGPVEDTIPANAPEDIAVLRLDTDWYDSTRHELEHLYPRVSPRGVLIIDDYGHWEGCRRAVDEYFGGDVERPLFGRIDYTGRMAVKA
jgi:O-methyltransferase